MLVYDSESGQLPVELADGVSDWISQIIEQHGKVLGDVTVFFCSDEYILQVNRDFLQHDYYTDIITFDYSNDKLISGDLVISIDTVKSNAIQYNQLYINELHRVVIHGIFHLLGFGDKTDKEELRMRDLENKALSLLFPTFI